MGFGDDDEGILIDLAEDALEGHDLAAADDAQERRPLRAGIPAAGHEMGDTPAHVLDDPVGDLLPAIGNHEAGFVAGETDDDHIHDFGGQEDVNQRVESLGRADEEAGGDHYRAVDRKKEGTDGNEREALVHHPGDHVGSAGGCPATHDDPQARAEHDPAVEGAQERIVRHGFERQEIDEHGEEDRRDETPEDKDPAHGFIADHKEGHVQDQ